jgi:hypothetical protein
MTFLSRITAALAMFVVSAPAFADLSEPGCRCSEAPLTGLAIAVPFLAASALLARRADR